MASSRRKARIAAMKVLYELDSSDHELASTLRRALDESALNDDAKALAQSLVEGVWREKEALDRMIQEHAPAWPVDQLAAVDRNILRIAIFEILFNNKTPPKAAINEAVELSKIFGNESLHRFVNGVLGSVMATANP